MNDGPQDPQDLSAGREVLARVADAHDTIASVVASLPMSDEDRTRIEAALLDLDRVVRGLTMTGHRQT